MKVLVIGAGLAGLSAAYELVRNGNEVTIIESESSPGGLARSVYYKGFTLDFGPHRIYSEYPTAFSLITLICAKDLITVERKSRIRLKNCFFQYPLQLYELIRYFDAFIISKFTISYLNTQIKRLFSFSSLEEISFERYLISRFGEEVYNFFFAPYAEKVWGIKGSALSADIAKVRVAQRSLHDAALEIFFKKRKQKSALEKFLYPRKGIGMIASKLADLIEKMGGKIIYNFSVISLQLNKEKTKVIAVIAKKGNLLLSFDENSFDYVISTIPLTKLVDMVYPDNEKLKPITQSLQFRNLLLLFLFLKREIPIKDTWIYFPEQNCMFHRVYFPKNFYRELCPDEKFSLCAEIGCFSTDNLWSERDADIFTKVVRDLKEEGLLFSDLDIEDYMIIRLPFAYPIYDLIYQIKLEKIFSELSKIDNLITTGRQGLFHHNNLDHSIIMGLEAAKSIQIKLTSKDWYYKIKEFNKFRILD